MITSSFIYHRFVTGNDFISRGNEVTTLTSLLSRRQHALIYDGPKSGKRSLVQQTFLRMRKQADSFTSCHFDLFKIRSIEDLCSLYVNTLFPLSSSTINDWKDMADKYLPELDPEIYEDEAQERFYLKFRRSPEINSLEAILSLPEKIAEANDFDLIIYFENFQNILLLEDPDPVLKRMEKTWGRQQKCTYLITGSKVNAMKFIFEEKKYFYNFAEKVNLNPLDEKALCEHIIKTFLRVGRVVEKSHARKIIEATGGHPWYTMHLATICFNMTKGYLNDPIINEAISCLMNIHSPYFHDIINNLSSFQLSFVKAALDNVTRFSSSEIIDKYELNSSANVFRLKEALKKKEILSFNEKDEPYFINPFFKKWLETRYFTDL